MSQTRGPGPAGLSLRDTKLLIFGSPVAGTPVMAASPLAAIEPPLKIPVRRDDGGTVWMSYADPAWLASRHKITDSLAAPLRAAGNLARRAAPGPPP